MDRTTIIIIFFFSLIHHNNITPQLRKSSNPVSSSNDHPGFSCTVQCNASDHLH